MTIALVLLFLVSSVGHGVALQLSGTQQSQDDEKVQRVGTTPKTMALDSGTSSNVDMQIIGNVTDATKLDKVNEFARHGDYLFAAARGSDSVTVVDISAPSEPVIVETIQNSTVLDAVTDIWYRNGYVYATATNSDSLVVLDASDPSKLSIVATISRSELDGANELKVRGDYAYVSAKNTASFNIIDVSNPRDPKFVSQTSDSAMDWPDAFYVGRNAEYAYIAGRKTSTLQIWDISDKSNPTLVSEIKNSSVIGTPEAVRVTDGYAYIANYSGGVGVIDVTDPSNPKVSDSLASTKLDGADELTFRGRYAWIGASTADRVVAVDINDPGNISIAGSLKNSTVLDHVEKVRLEDGYLYATASNSDTITSLKVARILTGRALTCPALDSSTLTCNASEASPLPSAVIEVWGVNNSSIDPKSGQTLQERANELLKKAQNPTPPEWDPDLQLTGSGGVFRQGSDKYVAIHSKSAWGLEKWSEEASLKSPMFHLPAGEEVVVSVWDPTEEDTLQDGINRQLYGETVGDTPVVFERLDPYGDVQDRIVVNTSKQHAVARAGGFKLRPHDYGTVTLTPGFYRVHPKGSNKSYIAVVGDKDALVHAIRSRLKNQAGKYTEAAKAARDRLRNDTFVRQTTRADEDGYFTTVIGNPNVEVVALVAYRGNASVLSRTKEPSLTDLINASNKGYNGSVYISTKPTRTELPARGVKVYAREYAAPPFSNLSKVQGRWPWLRNLLENQTFTDLKRLFRQQPSDLNRTDMEEVVKELNQVKQQNKRLRNRVNELLEQRGQKVDINVSTATNQTLLAHLAAMREAMGEMRDGTAATTESTSFNEGTASAIFTFGHDLSREGVTVLAHFPNGTTSTVPQTYWHINKRSLRGDSVEITGYPVNSTQVTFEVITASNKGLGRAQATVSNPSKPEPPAWDAVEVSTLRPSPGEWVTMQIHPESETGFRNVTSVSVWGPTGTSIPVMPIKNGTQTRWRVNEPGVYTVRVTYSDLDGNKYVETMTVEAFGTDVPSQASVRVAEGTPGLYAIVSGPLDRGDADRSESGDLSVDAVIDQQVQAPSTVRIYTSTVAPAKDQAVQVSILRDTLTGSTALSKRTEVILHSKRLSDSAIVYRFENQPITKDGTQYGKWKNQANGSQTVTYTNADSILRVRYIENPGIVARAEFLARTYVDIPGLFINFGDDVAIGSLAGLILLVTRRKRGDSK